MCPRIPVVASIGVFMLACSEPGAPDRSTFTTEVGVASSRVVAGGFEQLRGRAIALHERARAADRMSPELRREVEQLATDYREFAARTGHPELAPIIVQRSQVSDHSAPQMRSSEYFTCPTCPSVPDNEPLGYVCVLIDDYCDIFTGSHWCVYNCAPIETERRRG
jgi:hypothetical protein